MDEIRRVWCVSVRRACGDLKFAPKSYRYRSRRPGQAVLASRIKEICAIRVHVPLVREGWSLNHKRVHRIYSEMGLQLRNKSPRRRIKAKLREDRTPAKSTHDVWAMDFVHDQLATGGKIRILTLLDTYSRYAHAFDARMQYRAENVVATLDAVCGKVGYPKAIRVDQGTEFVSRDLDLWAYTHNGVLGFSRPGKPTDNAFIEAFNGRLRAECLNAHWFMSLTDAREKLEWWRRDYNEVRPHGAIGNKVPISLLNPPGETSPPGVKKAENSNVG